VAAQLAASQEGLSSTSESVSEINSVSRRGGLVSSPGEIMWDLWWTK
jgi:hypothetical protein